MGISPTTTTIVVNKGGKDSFLVLCIFAFTAEKVLITVNIGCNSSLYLACPLEIHTKVSLGHHLSPECFHSKNPRHFTEFIF